MLISAVHQELYKKPEELNQFCWLFLIQVFAIILILSSSTDSLAQTQPDKDPKTTEKSASSNIANMINKVANDNPTNTKNDTNKPPSNPDNNSQISKIVSSLVNKKVSEPSLMFTAEEINKIDQAIIAHKNNQPFNTENKADDKDATAATTTSEINSSVYLGSILYHSPSSWATWINGEKITNSSNKIGNEIYISSINEDSVGIVWTMSISKWKILADQKSDNGAPIGANNQVELKFELSFNQTYILNGGKIIEGRISLSPAVDRDKAINKNNGTSKTQPVSTPN